MNLYSHLRQCLSPLIGSRLDRGDKGIAIVEFAIVLPLLLLLVFGIMEFGFIIFDKAVVTNASREGARAGIVYQTDSLDGSYSPRSDSEIEQVINNYVGTRLINFAEESISVTISPGEGGRTGIYRGQPLTVTVNYEYDFLVLSGLAGVLGETVNIGAETIMRME